MNSWILFISLFALAGPSPESAKTKVERTPLFSNSDLFEGNEYRSNLNRAVAELRNQDFSTANAELRTIRAYCDSKISNTHETFVSVETVAQANEYADSHRLAPPIKFIDVACPGAYKMAAFLAIDERKPADAVQLLERAETMAPYWAEAWTEHAYLVRSQGDFTKALALYGKAITLVKEHGGSSTIESVALRGIGFILVEQGDLPAARKTYEEALGLDPESEVAKSELDYIGKLESGRIPHK